MKEQNQNSASEAHGRGTHEHDSQICMFDASGKTIIWLCGYGSRETVKYNSHQRAVLAAGGVPEFGFIEGLRK